MNSVIRPLLILSALIVCQAVVYSQSQTTGTLNLRNTQPETISLSIPAAGVAGYKILLPPTIGQAGQALTIGSITGTSAQLDWTNSQFWELEGSAISTGGVGAGQQYMGTSNAQDLVFATNATEYVRIIGAAGPTQGYIGLGTQSPQAPVDIAGNLLLSNSGSATELRFAEPSAGGTDYSAFKAVAQTSSVTYTLPPGAPAQNGMVLTSSIGGTMTWEKPMSSTPMGLFAPTAGNYVHVIPVGPSLTGTSVPIVSVVNSAGTTIGISITGRDTVAGTVTVETSVGLDATDRIAWAVFNQ
jgi:hypothetical protein